MQVCEINDDPKIDMHERLIKNIDYILRLVSLNRATFSSQTLTYK
jgi:hypothetical protein